MQLSIPVGWEVTVSNDSLITVDNRALYEVEEYQIFTLTKNRLNSNTKELNNHNMQIIMREIVQVELCCEIYEYGSLNSTTSYCISEDLEQKELIGSNIFVSYFLYDPKDPNSFFYFLSHTYGDEKINNQQILYRIFKSIIHKSVENIHLYSETILTKDSLLYYYPTMTNGDSISCQKSNFGSDLKIGTVSVKLIDSLVDFTITGVPFGKIILENENIGLLTYHEGEVGPYVILKTYDGYLKLISESIISSCQGDECYYDLSTSVYKPDNTFYIKSEVVIDSEDGSKLLLQKSETELNVLISGEIKETVSVINSSNYGC